MVRAWAEVPATDFERDRVCSERRSCGAVPYSKTCRMGDGVRHEHSNLVQNVYAWTSVNRFGSGSRKGRLSTAKVVKGLISPFADTCSENLHVHHHQETLDLAIAFRLLYESE